MKGHRAETERFARLYGGEDSTLSPVMAWRLWAAAVFMADTYCDPSCTGGLAQSLPPVAQRLVDDAWLAQLVGRFEVLARTLADGGFEADRL